MLQRLLLPWSRVLTKNSTLLFLNPANNELSVLWNSTRSKDMSLSLKYVGQLKTMLQKSVKNSAKKGHSYGRCGRLAPVWYARGPALYDSCKCFKYRDIMSTFQRIFRCSFIKPNLVAKITLGSAMFMPTTFFKENLQTEMKTLPIEIPKETKELKNKPLVMQFLLNIYECVRLILRGLRLLITFVPVLTLYPATYLGEKPTELWWGLLLRAIEVSGPIIIKFGQWMSTRHDLLPDTCCRQFSRLQRRIRPHSWAFTKYRMRKAFGPNWRKVFVKFDNDRKPVGSGCIAQVYKVWMSKDAIPDQELLDEIVSDLEDENSFEGLHVQGFGSLFGFTNEDEKAEQQAIDDWRKYIKEGESSSILEKSLPAVTKSLVSGIISGEEFKPPSLSTEENESNGNANEDAEHCLVEVWNDADHDKSLPVEECPPNDLEGLIPVAVKVLHPSVLSSCRRDLTILKGCASFLTFIYPPIRWLSLRQCVEEFADVMSGQINLKKEAENLERFSENFAEVSSIRFPRPLRPYVTQKVIVETFEEGEGMSEFIGASGEDKPNDLKTRLAEIGVDALLKMIFIDNLVHGDMHPGNMLIQNINITDNGIEEKSTGDVTRVMMVDVGCDTFVMDVQPDPNPLRICLLDCGIAAKLREKDLENFKAVFKHVVLGDGGQVADLFLKNSDHSCEDPQVFKTEMAGLIETARQNAISLAQVDVGILLQQVLGTLLKHQVRLESAFSAVVLAVFVLEGIGRTLDPNMNILEKARPILVT
ncbi:uncharacterized aarF domain-containing protein kinase 2-like isoform X2 [Palaemon carinicauda]|uniref:uncharacterized aarF domain-containing protein kinase 2-like isoform X2 n=1 Tax=Palaemon carinicauda TaxID=392227 RepID=UPI0035B60EE8